ncbi:MAG: ABC transporter permease [Alphaproteobacteria bacterium]
MADLSLVPFALTVITASMPLLLAATGELVVERSGVLNLGLEGMMLVGAVVAFIVRVESDSILLALLAGAGAGMAMASLFALLALGLRTNQVATGLALTIFGTGLSALAGAGYVGRTLEPMARLSLAWLYVPGGEYFAWLRVFEQNILFWFALGMLLLVHIFLFHSRAGLVLRGVGESHDAAHALGYAVVRWRFGALLFGGAMSGLAGAYISLAYTPLWSEGLTAGRGWIALALVVFAAWIPWRLLFGTILFGAISVLELYGQGLVRIAPHFLAMLPYLATIIALVLISAPQLSLVRGRRTRIEAPGSLAQPFSPPG